MCIQPFVLRPDQHESSLDVVGTQVTVLVSNAAPQSYGITRAAGQKEQPSAASLTRPWRSPRSLPFSKARSTQRQAFRLASVGYFVYILHMSTISLTRDEAIRQLQTVESEIRRLGVRRLALFGSVLRNEAHPDSDVDVLVEFTSTEKTFDRFMALVDLLETTLERQVEVVTTESLSPFIGPHILAEATDVLRAA
jgi:predicted nucleotidyltransferase